MLKPAIQLRIGQQLTMTPQLQQAIRLLQLSSLELRAEIQQNFETNPMLETEEDASEHDAEAANGADHEPDTHEASTVSDLEPLTGNRDDGEAPVDSSWEDIYDMPGPYSGGGEDNGRDLFENQSAGDASLRDHLLWQLRLTSLGETDQAIGAALIDAIDDDGYLAESLEAIHANLSAHTELELDELEAVLHRVQRLEPVGSGARDLAECLRVQLQQLPAETAGLAPAQLLVSKHMEALAARNLAQLSRLTGLAEADLQAAMSLIQSLNPRPGSQISSAALEYVVPDVRVFRHEGKWRVELSPESAPRLRINPLYAGMVKRADRSEDNAYMRNQLQEARWFIKSLQSRNETLLRVASSIVEHQRSFLEYGPEAMKPLVLRDIAEQLEMHESTISRVTTQKYMHTPRGIFEFKYFFSSHVATVDGGVASATAIRAMIKTLVDEEDRAKPFSDSKIAAILVTKGINVARRTVAKYREAMAIAPSNERKRLS